MRILPIAVGLGAVGLVLLGLKRSASAGTGNGIRPPQLPGECPKDWDFDMCMAYWDRVNSGMSKKEALLEVCAEYDPKACGCPGWVETKDWENAGQVQGLLRLMQAPEEYVQAAVAGNRIRDDVYNRYRRSKPRRVQVWVEPDCDRGEGHTRSTAVVCPRDYPKASGYGAWHGGWAGCARAYAPADWMPHPDDRAAYDEWHARQESQHAHNVADWGSSELRWMLDAFNKGVETYGTEPGLIVSDVYYVGTVGEPWYAHYPGGVEEIDRRYDRMNVASTWTKNKDWSTNARNARIQAGQSKWAQLSRRNKEEAVKDYGALLYRKRNDPAWLQNRFLVSGEGNARVAQGQESPLLGSLNAPLRFLADWPVRYAQLGLSGTYTSALQGARIQTPVTQMDVMLGRLFPR